MGYAKNLELRLIDSWVLVCSTNWPIQFNSLSDDDNFQTTLTLVSQQVHTLPLWLPTFHRPTREIALQSSRAKIAAYSRWLNMKLRTKIDIGLLIVVVVPVVGLLTIAFFRTPEFIRFSEAEIHRMGPDGREMPSNTNTNFTFQVETPSTFVIDGQRFRLLGVKEPIEDQRRQKAVVFMEEWLKTARSSSVVWFSNWSQALQDTDGTWIVWAKGHRGDGSSCLNVDLVGAGLAEVDYSERPDYKFREPQYGGLGPFVKWTQLLDDAHRKRSD